MLQLEIEIAIQNGYNTFLCGMALGFDMICAETVLDLKEKHHDIKIIGALPCRTQDIKWQESERNRYMVDSSSLMIALFNGLPGGTKSTIDYARKRGLEVVIIKI